MRLWLWLPCLLWLWVGRVNTSYAQPAAPTVVRTSGCADLDAAELVRLTQLELGVAVPESVEVAYRCDAETISIELIERKRDIRVSREMPRDCCKESAERTLALLAAGLYAVAAPMLSSKPPAPSPQPPTPQPNGEPNSNSGEPKTPEPAAPQPSAPVPSVLPPPQPQLPPPPIAPERRPAPLDPRVPALAEAPLPPLLPPTRHNLSAAGMIRIYNVGTGVTGYGARLRYLYWLMPELALGPIAEADFGSVSRMGGSVTTRVFHVGATAAWRVARGRWAEGVLSPFAALSVVQLEGESQEQDVFSGSVTGATGAAGLRFGAWLGEGPVRLDANAEAGLLFRAPRGGVADQSQVQLDGLWLGVGLGVNVGWGDSSDPSEQPAPSPDEPAVPKPFEAVELR